MTGVERQLMHVPVIEPIRPPTPEWEEAPEDSSPRDGLGI
jgi:hypothetical protein